MKQVQLLREEAPGLLEANVGEWGLREAAPSRSRSVDQAASSDKPASGGDAGVVTQPGGVGWSGILFLA